MSSPVTPSYLARGLKLSHLRLMAELVRTGQLGQAAQAISISQPAASRLMAELERITDSRLYVRSGRGIKLTAPGRALGERARRALVEVGDAERDIGELDDGIAGLVRIGAVTGPSVDLVLPALENVRQLAPQLRIEVEVATSDELGAMLVDNRLDFSLSRLPEGLERDLFRRIPVRPEPIAVIARPGHPLAGSARVDLADTRAFLWVLPAETAILRRTLARLYRSQGLPEPVPGLVTTALPLTLAYIQRSDALAVMAASVAQALCAYGPQGAPVAQILLAQPVEVETYMLLTRRGQALTPAAQMLHDKVRQIAEAG